MNHDDVVIVAAARTAQGRLKGQLAPLTAVQLGSAAIAGALARRSQGQPHAVVNQAWRAQQRLHRRYRHLVGHGKRPPVAVAAVARELVGFIWAAMTGRW